MTAAPSHGVLSWIARQHSLTVEDIRGDSKRVPVVKARWEAIKLLRERNLSLRAIAIIVNKDHKSVSNALRRIAA